MELHEFTNEQKEEIGRTYRIKLRRYPNCPEWLKEQLFEESINEWRAIQEINKKGGSGYDGF